MELSKKQFPKEIEEIKKLCKLYPDLIENIPDKRIRTYIYAFLREN